MKAARKGAKPKGQRLGAAGRDAHLRDPGTSNFTGSTQEVALPTPENGLKWQVPPAYKVRHRGVGH